MLACITRAPKISRIVIAYSGGVDSHALLHAAYCAVQQPNACLPICAVHINHQLQPQSKFWKQHCAKICAEMNIPFTGIDVDAEGASGDSPEAAARDARYHAIERAIREGDAVLTAHHRDDQAETVLLQMLRGSGVAGLAAMPVLQAFGAGFQLRPFLDLPKQSLREYASKHGLNVIEDPSNQSQRYQRNYFRNKVLPLIESRWPSASATIARVAKHSAESLQLNEALAGIDAKSVIDLEGRVDISTLTLLANVRQKNLLRYWIQKATGRYPSSVVLQSVFDNVIYAKADAEPLVGFESISIRRYRDHLYLVPTTSELSEGWQLRWEDVSSSLNIELLNIVVPVSVLAGKELVGKQVVVRCRQGGETIKLPGRPSKSVKALCQEQGIPPWQRNKIPLIFIDDELVAVYGLN